MGVGIRSFSVCGWPGSIVVGCGVFSSVPHVRGDSPRREGKAPGEVRARMCVANAAERDGYIAPDNPSDTLVA